MPLGNLHEKPACRSRGGDALQSLLSLSWKAPSDKWRTLNDPTRSKAFGFDQDRRRHDAFRDGNENGYVDMFDPIQQWNDCRNGPRQAGWRPVLQRLMNFSRRPKHIDRLRQPRLDSNRCLDCIGRVFFKRQHSGNAACEFAERTRSVRRDRPRGQVLLRRGARPPRRLREWRAS